MSEIDHLLKTHPEGRRHDPKYFVEDDSQNRIVYSNLLRNRGYQVAEGKDGAEAVELLLLHWKQRCGDFMCRDFRNNASSG
jgi:response regulator RpfG family c-di-GMP phosphodiesterase